MTADNRTATAAACQEALQDLIDGLKKAEPASGLLRLLTARAETMNLFDPNAYAAVRKPLLEAETLPPACYTSHEFYEREVSNIFLKCWNLIGRAEYLKNAGDYFTASLVGVSLIIIRGEDGHIRAFI